MKRGIAILLALTMALSLLSCAKKPEAQEALAPVTPNTDDAASVEPEKPEQSPVEWEYEVTTETTANGVLNDEEVLLATTTYELPVLGLKAETTDSTQPPDAPAEMEKVCAVFNDAMTRYRASLDTAEQLAADAQEQWDMMDEQARKNYFVAYEGETSLGGYWRHGDLLSVTTTTYGYWGGAHGGAGVVNWNFDLKTGEFVALGDLTDEPDALMQELRWNLLGKISQSGESEWYFEGYEDTVLAKEDFNVSFGEDGMTVYFDQYEIAPYAMGLLEFTIPYAEFSRFLNERGERLLDLTLTEKTLGEYYEAEEMWSWFEGAMPGNYEDCQRLLVDSDVGTIEYEYYRVDVPGVTTLSDLREKLLVRFSEELVDERLDSSTGGEIPILREFDGVLYALPAGRGDDMYIEKVDFDIEMNADETGGTVTATIFWRDFDEEKGEWVLTGETGAYEMPFEMTDNGARFTEFYTIW